MQFRHAFANYTSAIWDLLRILMTTYDFKQAMTKESWAVIYDLLGCGPLESSTVDVPPSIAVTSTPVGVADDLLMIHSYYTYDLLMIYLFHL